MRHDIIFRVTPAPSGDLRARALRYPVEVRATTQEGLRDAARKQLASYLGPVAATCRITLVRSRTAPVAPEPRASWAPVSGLVP